LCEILFILAQWKGFYLSLRTSLGHVTKEGKMSKKHRKIEKLDILGMIVNIQYQPQVELNGVLVAGVYYPDRCQIFVATEDRTDEQIYATLLHELGHAVFYRVGLHNTNVNPEVEEIIVDNIATVLVENFKFKP
jgi:uncharacterized protein YjaZ